MKEIIRELQQERRSDQDYLQEKRHYRVRQEREKIYGCAVRDCPAKFSHPNSRSNHHRSIHNLFAEQV